MYKAKSLSPMIPFPNIEKTVSFFTNLLQFEIRRDDKSYVVLEKDSLPVHIFEDGRRYWRDGSLFGGR